MILQRREGWSPFFGALVHHDLLPQVLRYTREWSAICATIKLASSAFLISCFITFFMGSFRINQKVLFQIRSQFHTFSSVCSLSGSLIWLSSVLDKIAVIDSLARRHTGGCGTMSYPIRLDGCGSPTKSGRNKVMTTSPAGTQSSYICFSAFFQ